MCTSSRFVVGSLRDLWFREGAYVVVRFAQLAKDHIYLQHNILDLGQVTSSITIQFYLINNKDSGQCNINAERLKFTLRTKRMN